MKRLSFLLFAVSNIVFSCKAPETTLSTPVVPVNNSGYWQQSVDYTMYIDMNVENYRYDGVQKLVYTNNSPDVLNKVYYHLYFNAFQPGSEMDVRSRSIADPDPRVGDRISKLKPDEIGYIHVTSLKQNGKEVKHKTTGTILEVMLNTPIKPGEKVSFDMVFDAQVPVQIRRSGRNNNDGVALSMTQWYPKLAEYDFEGWHADPYIGREFHGVWGNFDVTISIDKDYVLGGTGYLQNPNEIGHGYETGIVNRPSGKKLNWHFVAPNVHDFTWAADPEYVHDTMQVPDGPLLHFYYKGVDSIKNNWKELQPKAVAFMQYYSKHIGKYPYKQYSIIQGGDGGMEYAMCTLITGGSRLSSLIGTTSHEMAHTWFQFLLATNESKHEWMDEGFTTYISNLAENEVLNRERENPNAGSYRNYIYLANSGKEQPLTTHADRYQYNQAYGISAYSKGCVFMAQLGYVIGEEALAQTIKKYFNDWSFKHPTPNDFIRCAEKVSGLELDWYLTDFGQTTNTIDYAVNSITGKTVTLERIGLMPMPLDVSVTYMDGSTENYLIPLRMMYGHKPTSYKVLEDWPWTNPTYSFNASKEVKSVTIDPKAGMADANRENNSK